VILMIGSK